MSYDVIGDIHGHYEKLLALLQSLGYRKREGAFRHPNGRQAIFLGDLIDRGPLQEEVLYTVRDMIDAGTGRCIMGNHEWNAIGYFTPIGGGEYGKARNAKNLKHHHVFLDQVGLDSARHKAWVEWFKTLPPFLDLGGIRVAHACWRESEIATIQAGMHEGKLTDRFLAESFVKKPAPTAARPGSASRSHAALPETNGSVRVATTPHTSVSASAGTRAKSERMAKSRVRKPGEFTYGREVSWFRES